jgi:tripartite-type tricarboxylate transporter receptor subunit TctC
MKKYLLLLLLASVSCFADTLKIIVPYAPGGNTDLTARLIAKRFTETYNIDTVVVNKPGAEGLIGQNDLLSQKPDGNTVLFTGSGGIVYNSIVKQENYDNMRKLVPISKMTITGQMLLTKKDSSIKTWAQLVTAAKTRTVSIGTNSTIMRQMIEELFPNNPNIIIVPFNSDTSAYSGLLSNTVDVITATFVFETRVATRELNALAVTTEHRNFNTPSLKELGTGVSREQWYGFFAPPNTPSEIRNNLAVKFNTLKTDKSFVELVKNNIHANVSETLSPNEFSHAIEQEYIKALKNFKSK